MTAPGHLDSRLERRFLAVMALYFALHVLLRVVLSDSLDYDEAEQALLGQWLLPGYTEQPPLYTWLQILFFSLMGENVLAISLLKNCLLFVTYLFFLLAGRELLANSRAAVLASTALLFIPQIAWESQRDMTHTTLAVAAAAATLWQALRLLRHPTGSGYALLGLCIGAGILAKANYLLFLAVLLASLLTTREGRQGLCRPAMLLAVAVALAAAGSYLVWMAGNQDIVFSASHKFKRTLEPDYLAGILSLAGKSILFLTPLWLLLLLLFPAAFRPGNRPATGFPRMVIGRYLLLLMLLLLAMVLLFKVTYVKDRWLQPLLFVAPLYLFSRLTPDQLGGRRQQLFFALAVAAAVGIYSAFTLRVVAAPYSGHFSRLNYPFTAMATDLRESGMAPDLIVSNDRFLAGNLGWRFPGSTALIPGYRFEEHLSQGWRQDQREGMEGVVVWDGQRSAELPPALAAYIAATWQVDPTTLPVLRFQHLYTHASKETVQLAVVHFRLPEA